MSSSILKSFYRLSIMLVFATPMISYAETITLPEDELAKESVLPLFDKTVVVRERAIVTANRFEVGAGLGLNLAEPLYNTSTYNVNATYHFDEINAANVQLVFLGSGLSTAGEDLKAGKGLKNPGDRFDASLAPTVESFILGNYQFTAYYGKFSVAKESVMRLALYGLVGGGIVNWSDSAGLALNAGVGQKLYFTKNISFRLDLTVAMYQGPDPTDPKGSDNTLASGAQRSSDDFEQIFYFRPFLAATVNYLF